MSTQETELPFANKLKDIAGEIVKGIEPHFILHTANNAQMLAKHLEALRNDHVGRNRYELADALLTRDNHPSSRNIGRYHFPGNYISEAVAYTFVHTPQLFASWPDQARRYLLDQALQTDIEGFTHHDARAEARTIYIASGDYMEEEHNPIFAPFFIGELHATQNKLRERINPSPSQMRK